MTMFTRRCSRQLITWRSEFASGFKILLSLVLLTSFLTSRVMGQTITIDGNPSTVANEWCQSAVKHVSDKYNQVNMDTIFAGNEKDFMYAVPDWHWKLGTAKDKNDIANGAAALVGSVVYKGVTYTGNILAFAGDRISNNGDAQIGFWFFQHCTSPVEGGNFAPEKTVGDLLVLADFTGGGRDATVTVLQWVGTGGNYSESDAFNLLTTSAGVAENNNNVYPVPCGWSFIDKGSGTNTYAEKEFFEGFVDLGSLGAGAACFSCFMLETRSSQEITATLDDFVGGALGGVPSVTLNSPSRCSNGPCVTLTATASGAGTLTYHWTGPQGFADPGNVSSVCATIAGQYCVTVVNQNGCSSEPGCGTVTVNQAPTNNAGPDQTKCQGANNTTSFTLAATSANGTTSWAQVGTTGGATSNITSGTSLTGTVNVTGTGSVTLRLTTTSANCGSATDEVTLTVTGNPTAEAGNAQTQCRRPGDAVNTFGTNTFNISGTSSGSCHWEVAPGGNTSGYTVTFGNANLCATTVDISGNVNGGTVTLRLSVSSASCGTATDDVTLTLTALPLIRTLSSTNFCPGGTGSVSLPNSETGVSYQLYNDVTPVQAPQNGTGGTLTWTGLAAGNYSVVGTRIGTSCSTTSGPAPVQENSAPNPQPQNADVCVGNTIQLSATPAGGTWSGAHVSASGLFNASGVAAGTYQVCYSVTNTATPPCTAMACATVTVHALPTVTADDNEVCVGATVQLTASPAGGTWSGDHVSASGLFDATGLAAGPYTVTYSVTDQYNCANSDQATVTVNTCGGPICTYTQGYYGNPGGTSCDGTEGGGGKTTAELIAESLANWGGTLSVGCGTNGVHVSNNANDIACLMSKLPSGGAPKALSIGSDVSICSSSVPTRNGKISNSLLAQTLTLGLNLGIQGGLTGDLGTFVLDSNLYLETAEVVACGSSTIKDCLYEGACTDNGNGTYTHMLSFSPYHISSCTFSGALIKALKDFYTQDVAGLYALANDALCGNSTHGISLAEISAAEDCINNAFDECRVFVKWTDNTTAGDDAKVACAPSVTNTTPCAARTLARPVTESTVTANDLTVTAYPNPFTSLVKFTLQSKVSGQASLEVFNNLGQKVGVVYKGYLQANRGQVVEYKAPRAGSNLVYILRVGSKQVTGKLLRLE